MRRKDWDIIQLGDRLWRRTFAWEQTPSQPASRIAAGLPPDAEWQVVRKAQDAFQVVQITDGVVTCVRMLAREAGHGFAMTQTEVVELTWEGAQIDGEALCCLQTPLTYDFVWEPPARGEARLTGGFTVQRADGSIEYEPCPTATTKRS